jgi:hemerythrin
MQAEPETSLPRIYLTGLTEIDSEHEQIATLANRLVGAIETGERSSIVAQILNEICALTVIHFNSEESLMRKVRYPDFAAHVAEHQRFERELASLQNDQRNRRICHGRLMQIMQYWMVKHMLDMDRAMADFVKSAG